MTPTADDIHVGDEIFLFCSGRGGHGAFIRIERVLKASFRGTEREGSYQPGMKWTVYKKSAWAKIVREPGKVVKSFWNARGQGIEE